MSSENEKSENGLICGFDNPFRCDIVCKAAKCFCVCSDLNDTLSALPNAYGSAK